MRYLLIILLLFGYSCVDRDAEEFKEKCPYELAYDGHFLQVPVSISPHKAQYQVGDTLHIETTFSDSIYDLGTQQRFNIEDFPFKPTSLLYRFEDALSHSSGYRVNELKIDSLYQPTYFFSSTFADGYRAVNRYEQGQYSFKSQLILKEAGRYILVFSDLYQDNNASGNEEANEQADAISFEGKCPGLNYYICSMIGSGQDHLDSFETELVYLDENIYRGNLGSIRGSTGPLGSGNIAVEFSGFFGFEVVE